MTEINIGERFEELKKEEEKELEKIRQRREAEEEEFKKKVRKRNEEAEINHLKAKEQEVSAKLLELKKINTELEIQATSWENVSKLKAVELKEIERKLDRSHELIWMKRDDFCHKADVFIRNTENLLKHVGSGKVTPGFFSQVTEKNNVEDEIYNLRCEIATAEDECKRLKCELDETEKERERVVLEQSANIKRLNEWNEITRRRCGELRKRITERRRWAAERGESPGKCPNATNQLFSIVKLEQVKKLSQFKQF